MLDGEMSIYDGADQIVRLAEEALGRSGLYDIIQEGDNWAIYTATGMRVTAYETWRAARFVADSLEEDANSTVEL